MKISRIKAKKVEHQAERLRAARAYLNGSRRDDELMKLMAFMELVEGKSISRQEAEEILGTR